MDTLDSFFDNIKQRLESSEFKECPYPVYRGHSKGSYNLLPTLIRDYSKTGKDLWTLENNLYCDFRALAGPRVKFESSWELVFAMRHEGIPTRLLDWTENIGTALFFALDSSVIEGAHIWILNPYALNKKSMGNETLADPEVDLPAYDKTYADFCNQGTGFECHDLPIAIYPRRTNERIFAQRGIFTIHGKVEFSIEVSCPECVERVNLPETLIPKIRSLLKQFGINKYSVYPDFKGLRDHLKEIYKY